MCDDYYYGTGVYQLILFVLWLGFGFYLCFCCVRAMIIDMACFSY